MNPNDPTETLDDELSPDSEEEVEEGEEGEDYDGQPDSYQEHLDFAQDDGPYYDDGGDF